MPGPLTTRDVKLRPGSDELRALKRRLVGLSRVDREIVHLVEGPVLVRVRRFLDPDNAVRVLREKGRLDRAALERVVELESPPFPVGRTLFASLEHDLALVGGRAARAVARENRKASIAALYFRFQGRDTAMSNAPRTFRSRQR